MCSGHDGDVSTADAGLTGAGEWTGRGGEVGKCEQTGCPSQKHGSVESGLDQYCGDVQVAQRKCGP